MYIVMYFWSQALISARSFPADSSGPHFGVIFANFMSALVLGSLCQAYVTRDGNSWKLSLRVVQAVLCVGAMSLLPMVLTQHESSMLWAFCIFEFCVGLYAPSMVYLKSCIIGDEHRGGAYGFMRMPLNILLALTLGLVRQGRY